MVLSHDYEKDFQGIAKKRKSRMKKFSIFTALYVLLSFFRTSLILGAEVPIPIELQNISLDDLRQQYQFLEKQQADNANEIQAEHARFDEALKNLDNTHRSKTSALLTQNNDDNFSELTALDESHEQNKDKLATKYNQTIKQLRANADQIAKIRLQTKNAIAAQQIKEQQRVKKEDAEVQKKADAYAQRVKREGEETTARDALEKEQMQARADILVALEAGERKIKLQQAEAAKQQAKALADAQAAKSQKQKDAAKKIQTAYKNNKAKKDALAKQQADEQAQAEISARLQKEEEEEKVAIATAKTKAAQDKAQDKAQEEALIPKLQQQIVSMQEHAPTPEQKDSSNILVSLMNLDLMLDKELEKAKSNVPSQTIIDTLHKRRDTIFKQASDLSQRYNDSEIVKKVHTALPFINEKINKLSSPKVSPSMYFTPEYNASLPGWLRWLQDFMDWLTSLNNR